MVCQTSMAKRKALTGSAVKGLSYRRVIGRSVTQHRYSEGLPAHARYSAMAYIMRRFWRAMFAQASICLPNQDRPTAFKSSRSGGHS